MVKICLYLIFVIFVFRLKSCPVGVFASRRPPHLPRRPHRHLRCPPPPAHHSHPSPTRSPITPPAHPHCPPPTCPSTTLVLVLLC